VKVSPGRTPPRGYHYPVSETPRVVLEAITQEHLEKAICEWRMRNGKPPGDPRREYNDYVCSRWPTYCIPEVGDQVHSAVSGNPTPQAQDELANRVPMWAAGMTRRIPQSLVNQREADRRAEICAGCPRNRPWKGRCTGCQQTTESILIAVRRLSRTPLDQRLFGCEVAGFDCKTAVWLKEDLVKLSEDERGKTPPGCWRHTL
jgi:hypothetical protein